MGFSTLDLPFPLGCGSMVPNVTVTKRLQGEFQIVPYCHGNNKAYVKFRNFTGVMEIQMWMMFRKFNKPMVLYDSDEDQDADDDDWFADREEAIDEPTVPSPPTESTAPPTLTTPIPAGTEDDKYEKMSRPEVTEAYKKRFGKPPSQQLRRDELKDILRKDDKKKAEDARKKQAEDAQAAKDTASRPTSTTNGTIDLIGDSESEDEDAMILQVLSTTNAKGDKNENEEPANPDGTDMTMYGSDDEKSDKENEEPVSPEGTDMPMHVSEEEESDPQPTPENNEVGQDKDLHAMTIKDLKQFYCKVFEEEQFPNKPTKKKEIVNFIMAKQAEVALSNSGTETAHAVASRPATRKGGRK